MNKKFINNEFLENIRKAFFGYSSFGLWRLEQKFDQKGNPLLDKKGNPVITKVPYSALTLTKTDPTNPSNGASIDKVISVLNSNDTFSGVALFLTHDLYFIDLDEVSEDIHKFLAGDNNNIVGEFLTMTDTYTELSQSGTGLHIIGRGKKQTDRCKKKPVEIYDKQRFVALTGNVFDNRDYLNEIPQDTTKYLEDKYLGVSTDYKKIAEFSLDELPKIDESEEEIIRALETSPVYSERFKKLFYEGVWEQLGYESQSNADLAFMRMILKYTKGDLIKTKNIFDHSAMLREKTHSKRGNSTYFNQTFLTALNSMRFSKREELSENEVIQKIKDKMPEAFTMSDPYYTLANQDKRFRKKDGSPDKLVIEREFLKNVAELSNKNTDLMNVLYKQTNFEQKQEEDLQKLVKRAAEDAKVIYSNITKHYAHTEVGNMRLFLDTPVAKWSRFMYSKNEWWFYDGKRWTADTKGQVKKWSTEIVENLQTLNPLDLDGLTEEEQEKKLKAFLTHIKKSNTRSGIDNMMNLTASQLNFDMQDLDKDHFLFNMQNGYYDILNNEFKPHDPKKYMSKISSVEYSEHVAYNCPNWLNFLNTIFEGDQDLIDFIQRAIGYTLTGDTSAQVMFLMYGSKGRNGKGTFIRVLEKLFGDYGDTADSNILMMKQASSSGHTDQIANLATLRAVFINESNESDRFDEKTVKWLTGGDTVSASFKGGRTFSFRPQFKIWMSTNYIPRITGVDDGIWRRLPIIPFNYQVPEDQIDLDLDKKLLAELPAIFNWALIGAYEWLNSGKRLNPPQSVLNTRDRVRLANDPIAQFLGDQFEITGNSKDRIQRKDLMDMYNEWARENNFGELNRKTFSERMENREIELKIYAGIYYYTGLRKREENEYPYLTIHKN